MPDDNVADRVRRLRQIMAQGGGCGGGRDLESLPGTEEPDDDGPIDPTTIRAVVDQTEAELNRIVHEYLNDGECEQNLVREIVRRGDQALRLVGTNDAEFMRRPEMLADLEAIVRPDGSRPSFLIKEGRVDQRSSPLGSWGSSLDSDSNDLEKAIACVGRINDPSIPDGYGGTGVLVHENLILTNRHVVQAIARQQTDHSWKLNAETAIDFGHEYRGWSSVGRRKLKRIAFIGDKPIDLYVADHAKMDLAAIELEPATADAQPRYVLSVDADPDWAGTGGPTIYAIGYPFKPSTGVYTPTLLEQLFEQHWGFKRLAPGETVAARRTTVAWTAAYDATTLGGNSGSAVVKAGRPFCVMAIHYGGTNKEPPENWGHILGLALPVVGEAGEKLVAVLDQFGVAFNNRE